MASCCKLVDIQDIRTRIPQLSSNVTEIQLFPAFTLAQDKDLRGLIGLDCINFLCLWHGHPPPVGAPAEEVEAYRVAEAAVAELEAFLSWAVYYRYLQFTPSIQVRAAGTVKQVDSSEFAHATPEEAISLTQNAGSTTGLYRQLFGEWLESVDPDGGGKTWREQLPCLPKANCGCKGNNAGSTFYGAIM